MICGKMKRVFIWRKRMTQENDRLVDIVKNKERFIRDRIQWLDSDIRMGVNSDFEKQQKREMKEFLESLLPSTGKKIRVSGIPYEVDFQ